MNFGVYSYLSSIFIFCLPLLVLLWKLKFKTLKKYPTLLIFAALINLPLVASEFYALNWGAWQYYPQSVLPIEFGAQIETYVLATAGIFWIGSISLLLAERIDSKSKKR